MTAVARLRERPSDEEERIDALLARMSPAATDALHRAAAECGLHPRRVLSRDKLLTVVRARWLAFRYLREAGRSYPEIGAEYGVDSTTVLQALRQSRDPYASK